MTQNANYVASDMEDFAGGMPSPGEPSSPEPVPDPGNDPDPDTFPDPMPDPEPIPAHDPIDPQPGEVIPPVHGQR